MPGTNLPIKYDPAAARSRSFGKAMLNGGAKFLSNRTTLGAVAALSAVAVGYDVLKNGYEKGVRNAKIQLGQYYTDIFTSTNSAPKYSHLMEKIRQPIIKFKFDDPVFPAIVKTKHIIGSTIGETLDKAAPVLLTAGAALPFMIKSLGQTLIGKITGGVSAGLLILGGAGAVLGEFAGVGKKSS